MKYLPLVSFLFICQLINGQNSGTAAGTLHQPGLIHFTPTSFSNKFTLNLAPALTIHSGDTVKTETIDAAGYDKNRVKRQKGGNPLTGPFYIENALPGDVIAITLTEVALNRSYAFTTETFISRSLPKDITRPFKKYHMVKWKLDPEQGFAYPDSSFLPYEHLADYKVPLLPFVGCIGVAPANGKNEKLSFFQGPFGGNLDFKGVAQSATVYLPVFHEGAYLYIGDGHALQGDGEIAGNALETSLNVSFTVRLIKKDSLHIDYPRVVDADYLMAIGTDKTLDGALKIATTGLLGWLQHDYHLTIQEATQVLSCSIEYTIAEIADPEVEVVAKIKRVLLKGLKAFP